MRKYIEAEKAIKILRNLSHEEDADDAEILIRRMPAADVVEVVRCKDCKYMDLIYPLCNLWEGVVDEDGFCNMGEKE